MPLLTTGAGAYVAGGSPPPAYIGPADITASPHAWGGLRGVSAAYSTGSNPAVDIVDQAGANGTTINITTAGDLDAAAVAAWVTAHSVTSIKVPKLYDQFAGTGGWLQATLANMPTLVLSPSGITAGKYGLFFNAGQWMSATLLSPLAQPFTTSLVAEQISATGVPRIWVDDNGSNVCITVANVWIIGDGNNYTQPATDGIFHAAQGLYNGASSSFQVDATPSTGDVGNTFTAGGDLLIGADSGGSNPFDGYIQEIGWWAGNKTANNSTMNSNQHAYWGF